MDQTRDKGYKPFMKDPSLKTGRTRATRPSGEQIRKILVLSRELLTQSSKLIVAAVEGKLDEATSKEDLLRALNLLEQLFESEEEIDVFYEGSDFFVNRQRISADSHKFHELERLSETLQRLDIGSIHFNQLPSFEDLRNFILCFHDVGSPSESHFMTVHSTLMRKGIFSISVSFFEREDTRDIFRINQALYVKQVYFQSIFQCHQIFEQARIGRTIPMRFIKRIIQSFIDILLSADDSAQGDLLITMTQIKNWVNYTANHSVNVSIIALYIGIMLGFSKNVLLNLGVAALLHDIGYVTISKNIRQKPGPLTWEEWQIIQTHPVASVSLLTHLADTDLEMIKATPAIILHHKGYNGKGYPTFGSVPSDLFTEIISLVDSYDAMTTSRPFRTVPIKSEEAMKQLIIEAGQYLNPLLVKKFIRVMGEYPLGTPVLLNNGEIGMVVKQDTRVGPSNPPKVKILLSMMGLHQEGDLLDLAVHADKLKILRSVDTVNTNLESKHLQSILRLGLEPPQGAFYL